MIIVNAVFFFLQPKTFFQKLGDTGYLKSHKINIVHKLYHVVFK